MKVFFSLNWNLCLPILTIAYYVYFLIVIIFWYKIISWLLSVKLTEKEESSKMLTKSRQSAVDIPNEVVVGSRGEIAETNIERSRVDDKKSHFMKSNNSDASE